MGGPARRRSGMRTRMFVAILSTILIAELFPAAALGAEPTPTTPPAPTQPVRPNPTNPNTGRVVERPPVELGIPSTSGAGDAAIPTDPSIRPRPGFVPTKAPGVQTAVPDLWTETSRTFANPDGTYTVEISGGRLNYRDRAGAWHPLDLSLAGDANGDYAFRVKGHDRVVRIAAGPANRSLASLVASEGRLAIRALDFDASGSAGVPADGVARFTAPGRSDQLFVRGSDRGFEFGATIDSADAAGQYAFALDLGPLTASLAEDGQTVRLTKLSASRVPRTVGYISAPIVFDANDIPVAEGGVTVELITPGQDGSLSAAARAELRPNEAALIYTIDRAWLDDPNRAFPVTLDPDACLGEGASGCAINGTGTNLDHFVMSGLPTLYPTGWNIIRVGDDARTEPTPQDYGNLRSLVYFADVTLPDGAMVWDTNLRLHISSFGGTPAGQTISVYRVKKGWGQDSTWNEWSSGAGYDTTPVTSVTVPSSGNMNFDVDAIVQSWYTRRAKDWKGDIGFAVRMDYEGSDAGEVGFDRYNDPTPTYRPLLTISYEVPKVSIDFDPALGTNYSPSAMIAGQAAVLPVKITNNGSGFDFDTTDWRIGYRFFDAKSVLVSSGSQALTQCVGPGTGCASPSATIGLNVTPPTTVGQYTLRLDLVRNGSIDTFASDWATPSKFYSRNKKVLSSDNTRWTGSSVVERDEFSIAVVQGGGDTGTVKRVETGDGGSLGVDLWSRNLSYTGQGGVGFDDMLPIELDYGYDSKYVGDCGGILDGCGWWTTFDERLIEGSGTTYTYVDPSGNRHLVDTDPNQQIVSGASFLLQRPRMTLFDEQVPSVTTNLALVSGGSESPAPFTPFSGSWTLRATAPTSFPGSTDLGYSRDAILNTYRNVRFAIRTSGATTAAVGFQVKNLTTNASSKWFVYTIGGSSDWAAGDDHLWLGTGVTVGSGGWTYIARNLYQDVRDADLGGTTDEYRMDAMRVYYKSGLTGTHRTYLDALRLELAESTIVEDNDPVFTTGDSLATLVTNDVVAGTSALKVQAAALTSSPNCTTTNSCWSTSAGGLWSYAFAHWQWKKVGGRTAAVVFHFKDERTDTTGDLTYYAGPTPPAGAVNAIQVSDVAPEHWTKVTVNILEDARQVLNFYNDGPKTTSPGAPPSQGPTADDVRLTGYRLSAVDGNFLLIDDFDYGSLPSIGNDQVDHPNSASDTTFTYDFTATYPDGATHYFNTRGLLTRIADRDGNRVDFAWSIPDPTVYGTAGFRLDAIRSSTDGTTSASGTYDRELRFTYSGGIGTAGRSVTVEERLGTVATPVTGRKTVFTFSAANDVIALKPARTPGSTCPASGPSGCDLFTYDTSHLLTMVGDPRWDQQTSGGNDYRFEITWSGGAPAAIVDRSQATDTEILKVLTYDVTGLELPAASRAAWQDAAALRSSNALIEDLTSEGRQLFTYIPRACTSSPCTTANLPTVGTTTRATESQFDGLARETTSIAYRCPGVSVSGCTGTTAQKVVSRQGTKAGAKVNNYSDPLTAGQVGWSQTPDQYVASLRDSGGLGPELYRTFYAYDDNGQQVEAARSAYNARTSYSAAITSTTQSSTALKGYWRLGDTTTTATDVASSPHNGTYTNGAVFGRPDALVNDANTAAGFDGTNDFIAIPGTFPQINGSFSVEAWVRPDVQTATLAFIGSRKSNTSTTEYTFNAKLHYDTTAKVRNVRLDIGDGTKWLLNVNFPFDWQANRWYHVAAMVDDATDTASVAVNGELVGSQKFTVAGTPKLSDATRVLKIGNNGRDSLTPEWFDGDIDEVAIWQQVLTRVQVEGHYLAGLSASLFASQTLYDESWRPIQVDDQMLANAGFESLLTDWDFGQGSGGTVYAATSTSDPKVHQPTATNLPPSWASFNTGMTGNVQQDVQLVPGQTVRLQVWETRLTSTAASARVNLYYWRRSDSSWQALVNKAYQNASWTGHAWDVTLPWDTDGRVRVALWISGAATGDTVYFDDAALFTTYGRTTYTSTPFKGLIDEVVTLSPTQDGPIAEFRARNSYAATANHPAIFATAVTQNYENGTFITSAPDQDVTTTSTYDAWGHELTKTDQDGVATTTDLRGQLRGQRVRHRRRELGERHG